MPAERGRALTGPDPETSTRHAPSNAPRIRRNPAANVAGLRQKALYRRDPL